jgi:hypothetical protein
MELWFWFPVWFLPTIIEIAGSNQPNWLATQQWSFRHCGPFGNVWTLDQVSYATRVPSLV